MAWRGGKFWQRVPIPARLIVGLLLLVWLGSVFFLLPGIATRPLLLHEALFTAVSALTVTGLSLIIPARDLTLTGQIGLMVLIQIGGVGFMVAAVMVLRLFGRSLTLLDRLTLRDSLGLIAPGAILQTARQLLILVFAFELAGALMLWLYWLPRLGVWRGLLYAVFHAVSAFCNAGFNLFDGLPEFPHGIPNDPLSLAILGGLMFVGGLGLPVLLELLHGGVLHRLSLHTRITLSLTLSLFLFGTLAFWGVESFSSGALRGFPPIQQIAIAAFQSVSARTAGFSAVATFETFTPATQFLLIVLMFIGCAPASMGGGITTGTLAALGLGVWAYARGSVQPQIAGRTLGIHTIRRAAAVLSISLFLVSLATWLILATHPHATLDAALFEVVSAFATCGLSLAFTAQLNGFGLAIIMLMMFWGRLGALTIVLAFLQTRRASHLSYPEEQILLG